MNFKRIIPSTDLLQLIAASIIMLALTLVLTGCGGAKSDSIPSLVPSGLSNVGSTDENGVVIKSRAQYSSNSNVCGRASGRRTLELG